MRKLYHPEISQVSLEQLLYALSDPVRLEIASKLMKGSCECCQESFMQIGEHRLAKSTLSQHLKILREAGIIRSQREGVKMRNELRLKELKARFGKLVPTIIESFLKSKPKTE